jgi:hypothetical protein
VVVCAAPAAQVPEQPFLEYQVKAVFLLRIAQFTEWPQAAARPPEAPFVIGVLGEDPFGSQLDLAVAGEKIAGREVAVQRFDRLERLGPSDILFVSGSERRNVDRVLKRIAGEPTLTVGDFQGFVGQGGAVELYLENERVRFRIDRAAAQAAGLSMRSQLLRAAASVQ